MSVLDPGASDPAPKSDGAELQFDRAEYADGGSGPTCSSCQGTAAPKYYEANGQVFCTGCREKIETDLSAMRDSGSVPRALLLGVGAALIGALIYYLVSLTGYEFALVAILVGFIVGKAVRHGSGMIGGRRYQVIAVMLTYLSISSSYAPMISKGYLEDSEKRIKAATELAARNPTALKPEVIHLGVFYYAFIMVFALIAPILMLFNFQSILGPIIIAIGLWQAWKMNRRLQFSFTGPFTVSSPEQAAS